MIGNHLANHGLIANTQCMQYKFGQFSYESEKLNELHANLPDP